MACKLDYEILSAKSFSFTAGECGCVTHIDEKEKFFLSKNTNGDFYIKNWLYQVEIETGDLKFTIAFRADEFKTIYTANNFGYEGDESESFLEYCLEQECSSETRFGEMGKMGEEILDDLGKLAEKDYDIALKKACFFE